MTFSGAINAASKHRGGYARFCLDTDVVVVVVNELVVLGV
jgi:hypothetical protein